MQKDNAAFQFDPSDPGATAARAPEKAAMEMAQATPVKKGRDPEAAEYNPYDHREVEHPLTNFDVLFHMMKASCGSGILAMPQAFANAGYVLGLAGTAIIGFICTYCVHILIQSEYAICKRRKIPCLSINEIAREGFMEGPPFMKWFSKIAGTCVHVFLGIYQLGTMSVYTVFVASSMKAVADQYGTVIDVRLYMCMLLPILILVNWIRNLKYLAPFSSLALFSSVVAFAVVLKYIFEDLPSIATREPIGEVANWPLFFGTVLFALEAIGVVVPLGNEMRKPHKYLGWRGVLNQGMVPIVLLYIFLGFTGYIKYGDKADGSITLNLPETEVLAQVVKILMAIAIFGTHPLQCYVLIDIVWGTYVQPFFLKHPRVLTIEYVVRTLLVIVAFLLAVAIPNLGPFISLVGALSLSVVGIMLPALTEMGTFWYYREGLAFKWLVCKNMLLAIFALIGLCAGTYASVNDIIKIYQ